LNQINGLVSNIYIYLVNIYFEFYYSNKYVLKFNFFFQCTRLSYEEIAGWIAQNIKSVTYIVYNTGGDYEVDPRSHETLKLPHGWWRFPNISDKARPFCTHIGVIVTHHEVAEVLPPMRGLWERKTREPRLITLPGKSATGGGSNEVVAKELLAAILTLILDGAKKKHSQ